jgi:hypothetical protein
MAPSSAILLALLARAGLAFQRVTTCSCDGSLEQQWEYPTPDGGLIEAISTKQTNSENDECLTLVPGGPCAWANNTCLELGPCDGDGVALFNVTRGRAESTVIFQLATAYDNHEANTLCVDFNADADKLLLEIYACYPSSENKKQEWTEKGGTLIEYFNRGCLCRDTRNSATPTPSLTPSATPSAFATPFVVKSSSPTRTPRASPFVVASSSPTRMPPFVVASSSPAPAPPSQGGSAAAALGVGIPLGLIGAAAIGLAVASSVTGPPMIELAKHAAARVTGVLRGGAGAPFSAHRTASLAGAGGDAARARAGALKAAASGERTGLLAAP